jgi:hypothetical protein
MRFHPPSGEPVPFHRLHGVTNCFWVSALSAKSDVIPGQNVLSDRPPLAGSRAIIVSRYSIRTARAWLDAYRSLAGTSAG